MSKLFFNLIYLEVQYIRVNQSQGFEAVIENMKCLMKGRVSCLVINMPWAMTELLIVVVRGSLSLE
jgi:hypothetical protein